MKPTHKTKHSQKAFTLIELLIVIAILAIIATTVALVLNPQELLKQARDSTRLSELKVLDSALSLYNTDKGGIASFGDSNKVYISLPDSSSTCANHTLPSLPSGWTYSCVTEANLTNIDSTGWIPVDFTSMSISSPLSRLPIDPRNTDTSGMYYTYIAGSYHLEAPMESERYQESTGFVATYSSSNNITVPGSIRGRACGDGGTLTDSRNSETYNLTLIGEGEDQQCWFADNLNYDNDCTNVSWVDSSDEGWCGYHSSDTGEANGLLYQWSAAMNDSTTEGAQGLCPSGWHIPTDNEYKTMEKSLGMSQSAADSVNQRGTNEGAKLKQAGTNDPGWSSETCGDTTCNLSGWDATGGGFRRYSNGSFAIWRTHGYFWTSSLSGSSAWNRGVFSSASNISRNANDRAYAWTVRCLKD